MDMTSLLFALVLLCVTHTNVRGDDDDIEHFGEVNVGASCDEHETHGGWSYRGIQGSCNQYIQCTTREKAYLLTCAAGTFYDGITCRHSSEVNCYYDPCHSYATGFKYSDGQSCYGFYQCIKGRSKYHSCPNGFYFSSHKQSCFPDPTCHKDNLEHPCSYGTTYPFPGRPEFFYLYNGMETFYPMKCPKGLWYRPDICSCDWIIPGVGAEGGCKPMFHFQYNGNFLESLNKIQQVPNTGVSIFRKSALFSKGGHILIWAMNNLDMDSDFSICFEFMTKAPHGEVALLSNDYKNVHFTYKLTHITHKSMVKAYIMLKDGTVAELSVLGVHPMVPHFLRLAKFGKTLKLRIDNMPAAIVQAHAGVAPSTTPMVIGAAKGCDGFIGHFDEFKFFRCMPDEFFSDYDEDRRR